MEVFHYRFNEEYELMLCVAIESLNSVNIHEIKQDLINKINIYKDSFDHFPDSISLRITDTSCSETDHIITDLSFLSYLKTLKELILADSIKEIKIDETVRKLFAENKILIRGSLNSYAERFAAENRLNFRPDDYVFAHHVYLPAKQDTILTLQFERNGNVKVKEEIRSSQSDGDKFEATFYHNIGKDFYTKTAKQIARQFRDVLYEQILSEGRLALFLEEINKHDIYQGGN